MRSSKATDSVRGGAHESVRSITRKLNAKVLTYFSQHEGDQLRLLRQRLLDISSEKSKYTERQLLHWHKVRQFLDADAAVFNATFLAALDTSLSEEVQALVRDGDGRGAPTGKLAGPTDRLSLSLVGAEEMDQMLFRDQVVQRFNARYDEALTALNQSLRVLFGRESATLQGNPYRPEILVRALLAALKNCSIDEEAAQSVLHAFDPQHSIDLDPLYAELDRILVQSGIVTQTHRVRKSVGSDTGQFSGGGVVPSEFSGFSSSAAMPGYGYPPRGWAAASPAREFLRKLVVSHPPAGLAADTATSGAAPWSGSRFGAAGFASGRVPIEAQLVSYLEELQASAIESFAYQGLDIDLGGGNILREMRDHAEIRNAQEFDRGTVEALAEVFEFVFADPNIAAPLKVIIGRLQIPVLKAALMDRHFFSSASHPARRLIDALAAASVAWTPEKGIEDPLYLQIEATVKRLLTEFAEDLALFSEVLLEFEEFVEETEQQAKQEVQRAARVQELEEEIEAARAHADEVIHERIVALSDDHDRAAFLLPFLTTQWREVLARALAHHTAQPEQWTQLLATTDQLLWSTEKKRDAAERRQLVAVLPGLVRRLNASLDALDWGGDERDTFTRRLIATHMNAIRSTAEVEESEPNPQDQRASEQAISMLNQRLAAAQVLQPDDLDVMAQGFERGMWFDFLSEEAHSLRCRLTWISPKRSRFLFTNREGFDAFVRTQREVTELLRQGRLRLLSQEPIVARALDQIMAAPVAVQTA